MLINCPLSIIWMGKHSVPLSRDYIHDYIRSIYRSIRIWVQIIFTTHLIALWPWSLFHVSKPLPSFSEQMNLLFHCGLALPAKSSLWPQRQSWGFKNVMTKIMRRDRTPACSRTGNEFLWRKAQADEERLYQASSLSILAPPAKILLEKQAKQTYSKVAAPYWILWTSKQT